MEMSHTVRHAALVTFLTALSTLFRVVSTVWGLLSWSYVITLARVGLLNHANLWTCNTKCFVTRLSAFSALQAPTQERASDSVMGRMLVSTLSGFSLTIRTWWLSYSLLSGLPCTIPRYYGLLYLWLPDRSRKSEQTYGKARPVPVMRYTALH